MKKRLFALLTAALLLIPVLATAFVCDNCDYEAASAAQRVIGTATEGDTTYEIIEYFCPNCGAVFGTDRKPVTYVNTLTTPPPFADSTMPPNDLTTPLADLTDPPVQSNEPPVDKPTSTVYIPPAETPNTVTATPEVIINITDPPPVTPPPVDSETPLVITDVPPPKNITLPPQAEDPILTRAPDPGNALTNPPVADLTLPPAIPTDTPVPVPDVTVAPATPKPTGASSGFSGSSDSVGVRGRDYKRHPVFSGAFPSRRLNLPGDPEAQAPRAGTKIWPEEEKNEAQSLLDKMLNAGQ